MNIVVDTGTSPVLVTLEGRFDAHETEGFRTAVDPLVDAGQDVVIGLGDVNFVDSSALAELVRAMKRCREHGHDLVLDRPSQPVAIILELTGLHHAFTITETA